MGLSEARVWFSAQELDEAVFKVLRRHGWPSTEHVEIARDLREELGFSMTTPTPVPPAGDEEA